MLFDKKKKCQFEGNETDSYIEVIWASMRDLSSGFPTMQDANQPAHLQRLARKLASFSIILSKSEQQRR